MSFYCAPCKKSFASLQTLNTHQQSAKHKQQIESQQQKYSSPIQAKSKSSLSSPQNSPHVKCPHQLKTTQSPATPDSNSSALSLKAQQCLSRAKEIGIDFAAFPFLIQSAKCFHGAGRLQEAYETIADALHVADQLKSANPSVKEMSDDVMDSLRSWLMLTMSLLSPDESDDSNLDSLLKLCDRSSQLHTIEKTISLAFQEAKKCRDSDYSRTLTTQDATIQRISSLAIALAEPYAAQVVARFISNEKIAPQINSSICKPPEELVLCVLSCILLKSIDSPWILEHTNDALYAVLFSHFVQSNVQSAVVPKPIIEWSKSLRIPGLPITLMSHNLQMNPFDEKLLNEIVYVSLRQGRLAQSEAL
eukprot:TRINITY_DN4441_c0_g1_i13.p1 TRINITY_DN4441_c0_g1~~TRINITY_DN4441_c0_g1_i13.p1  ORF type:complete len:362 (-),score=66.90 TRINITY_DN4441_c0_g1_i13:543-1628(-)